MREKIPIKDFRVRLCILSNAELLVSLFARAAFIKVVNVSYFQGRGIKLSSEHILTQFYIIYRNTIASTYCKCRLHAGAYPGRAFVVTDMSYEVVVW